MKVTKHHALLVSKADKIVLIFGTDPFAIFNHYQCRHKAYNVFPVK